MSLELDRSNPRWVGRVEVGAMLLVTASGLLLLRRAMMELAPSTRLVGIRGFCHYAAMMDQWIGWWLITTPPPHRFRFDLPAGLRVWARTAVLFAAGFSLLILLDIYAGRRPPELYLGEAVSLMGVVVLINTYLRRLAWRIPDVFLLRHLPILMALNLLDLLIGTVIPEATYLMHLPSAAWMRPQAPLTRIIGWTLSVYGTYVLFHLWRRTHAAAELAVVNWARHEPGPAANPAKPD